MKEFSKGFLEGMIVMSPIPLFLLLLAFADTRSLAFAAAGALFLFIVFSIKRNFFLTSS